MLSLLLKKALPFALTFVAGAALSGLAALFGFGAAKTEAVSVPLTIEVDAGPRHSCPMGRHKLVAVSKPLEIIHVPDAPWPRGVNSDNRCAVVSVTFGADGKVRQVAHPRESAVRSVHDNPDRLTGVTVLDLPPVWEAVVKAARQIEFEPETVNGVPVTVTKEIEIRFRRD